MAGVETLKKQSAVLDAFCDVLKAAKEDDGEVSFSDLFDRDVWDKGLDFAAVAADVVDDWDALKAECADLDAVETLELCQHYLASFERLWDCLKDAK